MNTAWVAQFGVPTSTAACAFQCTGNGRVWVNCYNRLPAGAPFGGYKTSGIGRETHKMVLTAYTQVKNIYISTREEREGFY